MNIPKRRELVVCRVKSINPHSAVARIVEYNTTGLIHVSEVASRWVRNIREFLKINQYVVCRVMRVDGNNISLSVKRVYPEESARKLNEFKRERRAEKLLEMAGKKIGKTQEDMKREIGRLLKEEFGSFWKTFEIALKNPDLLTNKGLDKKWAEAIIDIAKKNYKEKVFRIKGNLRIVSYEPDGVEKIKKITKKAEEKGIKVQYVSAPKYVILGEGRDFKEIKSRVEAAGEEIVKEFSGSNGEASFELEKD